MQPARNRLARIFIPLALLATLIVGSAPAQAGTGGAAMAHTPTAADGSELVFSPFRSAGASWYGPGLYGNRTACGQTLRASTIGVAHKTLPCGTMVKFAYRGRAVVAPVIDRGPYVKGRAWDLTAAASEALGLEGVGMVRYAVAVEYARVGTSR